MTVSFIVYEIQMMKKFPVAFTNKIYSELNFELIKIILYYK